MISSYDRTGRQWINFCNKNITAGPTSSSAPLLSFPGQSVRKARQLQRLLNIQPGDHLVDIGCGNGRVPIGFAMDNFHIQYTGVEVIKGCVDFCKLAFEDADEFTFHHLDIRNSRYNPHGKIQSKITYPIESDYADFVIFSSVFSHIVDLDQISQMLDEAYRILKPDAICYCTWFLSPPNKISTKLIRVVHPEETYRNLISKWHLIKEFYGNTRRRHDQRRTILQKGY